MNRTFLLFLCGFALIGGALSQAADDDNEGVRFTRTGVDSYTFSHLSKAGRYYFLQHSEDLVHWSYFPFAHDRGLGVPARNIYYFSVSEADRFFVRLKYLEPYTFDPNDEHYPLRVDYDGDKVSTVDELDSGTDPFHSPDLDGDLMPDDWEIHFFPNDHIDDTLPSADSDGDGKDNITEYGEGNDPTDHYNGIGYPSIVAINQPIYQPVDEPGTFLTEPLVFEVKDGATPVNHALVTVYTEGPDFGQVSPNADGSGLAPLLHLWTGSDGRVQVYFKHPSAVALGPTSRYIFAKVGSALISGNGNSVVPAVVVITQSDYTYPPNTVGRNATEAIDGRINMIATNNVATAKLIFSTQYHGTPQNPTPN